MCEHGKSSLAPRVPFEFGREITPQFQASSTHSSGYEAEQGVAWKDVCSVYLSMMSIRAKLRQCSRKNTGHSLQSKNNNNKKIY